MTTPDVNTILVNFDTPGKELVVQNEDGSYTVLINAKLSQDGQLKAYRHALNHITNGDFEKSDVVLMSTYEEFMVILTVALLIVAVLNMKNK